MKKVIIFIFLLFVLAAALYPKSYLVYPGYTSIEDFNKFKTSQKRCIGFSVEKNKNEKTSYTPDAPEYKTCYGVLF